MKYIIFGLVCLAVSRVNSQITVTSTDFADGGDMVYVTTATDPAIDFASTGTDYTWDFSGLTPTDQTLKEYTDINEASTLALFIFGTFAPPAYQATNFTPSTAIPVDQIGTFLPVSISEINLVSKSSSNAINSVGYTVDVNGTEVPFKSDTIETRYELPLNYGDVYASRGYSNLDMNPIYNGIWRQYRQRESNVDGWGEITTPHETFDALRVRHIITETDSIYMEVFGVPTWIPLVIPTTFHYEWWASGQLEPVLRIETRDVLGEEVVSNIEYRDDFDPTLGIGDKEAIQIEVYPNPATEYIIMKDVVQGTAYAIIDAAGAAVQHGVISEQNEAVSVAALAQGRYQLVIHTGKTITSANFIKK